MKAKAGGVEVTFTDALDAASAADVKNYEVKAWGLSRTKNYGSKHIDEKPLAVAKASLMSDGKTVRLDLPDLAPTWGMEIKYRVKGSDGRAVTGVLHNTIHDAQNRPNAGGIDQGLGRSRGPFGTKVHLTVESPGLPLEDALSLGQDAPPGPAGVRRGGVQGAE